MRVFVCVHNFHEGFQRKYLYITACGRQRAPFVSPHLGGHLSQRPWVGEVACKMPFSPVAFGSPQLLEWMTVTETENNYPGHTGHCSSLGDDPSPQRIQVMEWIAQG